MYALRHLHTYIYTRTQIQTDRHIGTDTDRHTGTYTGVQTDTHALVQIQTNRKIDTDTLAHTDTLAYIQAGRQTHFYRYRQALRQTQRTLPQRDRQTHWHRYRRQTDTERLVQIQTGR